MKIINTKIEGVYIIEPDTFGDKRGSLTKTFHKDTFTKEKLADIYEESFYSVSKKGVIRGMHFQVPPEDHCKTIYIPHGSVLDVILDIRKSSPTYGQYITAELSGENHKMIYIPKGCAHGFLVTADDTCMVYLQSTMRSAEHEGGIRFDSFGMDWGIKEPIISDRDLTFPTLADFKTPFV